MDVNYKDWGKSVISFCRLFFILHLFLKVLTIFEYRQLDNSYEHENNKQVNLRKFPIHMWNDEA
jgi:hypothetical protein